jgi:hypothetical protein
MSRILLTDIVNVVRLNGETGSFEDPRWSALIQRLGDQVDASVDATLAQRTLSDLLDEHEAPREPPAASP